MSAVAAAQGVRSQARRETLWRLLRSPTFLVGTLIVGFWIFCAFYGSKLAPYDPLVQYDNDITVPPGSTSVDDRHVHFLFGTDQLGRDVLSRVLTGATDTLRIAPAATLVGIVGGTVLGLLMGYFRGWLDDVLGRAIDAFLALPLLIVAITALTGLGHSNRTLVLVIGFAFSLTVSRTVRAAVLAERDLDYIQAAQLRGERAPYILFVEILPNIMGPIIVEATVRLGYAIFTVAALTFLGFGVQPPSPDWSLQVADNFTLLVQGDFAWTVLPPALAIASLVVGVNLIADGLQETLDR